MKNKLLKITIGISILILLVIGGAIMLNIFKPKYNAYVNGELGSKYDNVKKQYREGQTVKIKVPFVTDASYRISTDEKDIKIKSSYTKNDYVYTFKMPKHEVHINIQLKGDMIARYTLIKVVEGRSGTDGYDTRDTYEITSENEVIINNKIYSLKNIETLEEEINNYVKKHKIDKWNDKKGIATSGGSYYAEINIGEYNFKVSNDNMPENGPEIIKGLEDIILNHQGELE